MFIKTYQNRCFQSQPRDQRATICIKRFVSLEFDKVTTDKEPDAKDSKIIRWLRSPDPCANHNAARAEHSPATGSWFIESDAFQSWWNEPSQFLWIHGRPGCGKSVLASTIIDHAKFLCQAQPAYKLAYFYFDFRQETQQSLDGFLRSLLVQLSYEASAVAPEIRKLYDQHDSKSQQPSVAELSDAFMSILKKSQPFYLIVDALDECSTFFSPGRSAVLSLFERIKNEKMAHVNVLILSRQARDIADGLRNIMTNSVCIQNKAVDADIRVHIRRLLADDSRLRKWSPMVKKEIEASLIHGARGM